MTARLDARLAVVTGAGHEAGPAFAGRADTELGRHRAQLVAHCRRMLGSPFEAEDAVQVTLFRAWRGLDRFEGRASLRSWLYQIATNVCLDMQNGRERRARPMDLGPARAPEAATLPTRATATRIEPIPTNALGPDGDPADAAVARERIRLAFVAVLRRLPARQRAVLILCEVLCWRATEAAQLLDTTVASVTSALQRARKTLQTSGMPSADSAAEMDAAQRGLLARYVEAFRAYDIDGLTSLIKEDATQSISASDPSPRGPRDRMTPACRSAPAAGAARTGAR
jgi:RNA polymerase sigma-70 factor, ECF subfamily